MLIVLPFLNGQPFRYINQANLNKKSSNGKLAC